MVAARDVLTSLLSMGIAIEASGDRLRYRPRSAMTPDLLAAVKRCKAGLLELLSSPGGPGAGSDDSFAQDPIPARATPVRSIAQPPADGDSYADREWARFLSVAVATSNGWRDPAEPVLQRGVPGADWQRFIDDFAHLGRAVRP